jgi:hypothetical protein
MASRLSPPFLLPGQHFAAGMAFLVIGAAGLVWVAPDLAAGTYVSPRVVAVTHLFTLGWITLSIFGALYQFLPVALGQGIRWPAVAHLTFWLFVAGLGPFAAGLAWGFPLLTGGGAALFGVAILLFCWNLVATLARSERRDVTWWSLAAASLYLSVTAVLGLLLAGNLHWGFLGAARWTALGVHLHLALGGWVLMVVIGVGNKLLPMFLLSHGSDERWGRAAAALVAGGVGCLVVFHHAPALLSAWLPAVLVAGGLAAFLAQAASFFRHSVKPRLDPGLRLAAAALGVLAMALLLGGWSMVAGWSRPESTAAYGSALVLGFALFVAGHYYKIVPFLVWYHRYGPLLGERPIPQVAELYSGRWAGAAAVLLAVGFAGVVLAIAAGVAEGARAAAVLGVAGASIQAVQMGNLARRRP